MRYCPEPSVTAVRTFSISASLAASTVTPGSTAPEESRTTPVRDPWARAGSGMAASAASAKKATTSFRMASPLAEKRSHESRDLYGRRETSVK